MVPKTLTVTMPADFGGHKVLAIKAIRTLTRLGLKEAKDISDIPGKHTLNINPHPQTNAFGVPYPAKTTYLAAICDLKTAGVVVPEPHQDRDAMLDEVRQLASVALLKGDYDLSNALVEVLRQFS